MSASSSPAEDAPTRTPLARTERASLCRLLEAVGPAAPTLSGDWVTFQLAAHLSLRERNPLQLLRLLRPCGPSRAVDDLVADADYSELVRDLRHGPPPGSLFRLPRVDRNLNALEFFVHHEDVRRARAGWTPRELPVEAQAEIWSRIGVFGRVLLRSSPVGIEFARSDTTEIARVVKGADSVVVRGLPSELALFAYGRSAVSVEFDGSAHAVSTVQEAGSSS